MATSIRLAKQAIDKTEKNETDIEAIVGSLRLFPYFEVLKGNENFEELLKECAGILKIRRYQQGQTIFLNREAKRLDFFLIYGGQVGVLVDKNLEEIEEERGILEVTGSLATSQFYFEEQQLASLNNPDLKRMVSPNGILLVKQVKTLGVKCTFGELSVMTDDQKRTASVVALTSAEIAYLEEKDFRRLFKDRIEMGIFVLNAMKTIYGENCPRALTGELSGNFDLREVRYGNMLYRTGQTADLIYLIKKGQVELKGTSFRKQAGKVSVSENSLIILGPGQFFGQEQLLQQASTRICSAYCVANETIVCTIPIEKVMAAKFEVLAEKICAPSHKVRDWIHALPLNNRTASSSEMISQKFEAISKKQQYREDALRLNEGGTTLPTNSNNITSSQSKKKSKQILNDFLSSMKLMQQEDTNKFTKRSSERLSSIDQQQQQQQQQNSYRQSSSSHTNHQTQNGITFNHLNRQSPKQCLLQHFRSSSESNGVKSMTSIPQLKQQQQAPLIPFAPKKSLLPIPQAIEDSSHSHQPQLTTNRRSRVLESLIQSISSRQNIENLNSAANSESTITIPLFHKSVKKDIDSNNVTSTTIATLNNAGEKLSQQYNNSSSSNNNTSYSNISGGNNHNNHRAITPPTYRHCDFDINVNNNNNLTTSHSQELQRGISFSSRLSNGNLAVDQMLLEANQKISEKTLFGQQQLRGNSQNSLSGNNTTTAATSTILDNNHNTNSTTTTTTNTNTLPIMLKKSENKLNVHKRYSSVLKSYAVLQAEVVVGGSGLNGSLDANQNSCHTTSVNDVALPSTRNIVRKNTSKGSLIAGGSSHSSSSIPPIQQHPGRSLQVRELKIDVVAASTASAASAAGGSGVEEEKKAKKRNSLQSENRYMTPNGFYQFQLGGIGCGGGAKHHNSSLNSCNQSQNGIGEIIIDQKKSTNGVGYGNSCIDRSRGSLMEYSPARYSEIGHDYNDETTSASASEVSRTHNEISTSCIHSNHIGGKENRRFRANMIDDPQMEAEKIKASLLLKKKGSLNNLKARKTIEVSPISVRRSEDFSSEPHVLARLRKFYAHQNSQRHESVDENERGGAGLFSQRGLLSNKIDDYFYEEDLQNLNSVRQKNALNERCVQMNAKVQSQSQSSIRFSSVVSLSQDAHYVQTTAEPTRQAVLSNRSGGSGIAQGKTQLPQFLSTKLQDKVSNLAQTTTTKMNPLNPAKLRQFFARQNQKVSQQQLDEVVS